MPTRPWPGWASEIDGEDSGQTRHMHRRHRRGALSASQVAVRRALGRLLRHHLAVFRRHGGATLGQRGHSKDFRPQLPQVVLGIVLDEQDRPIASFLWPGNTADVTTLLPVVERLRSRFGVERACIVADRGMISAATIAALEAQKIDYILGARERSSKEVRETVLHDDGAAVPLTIPRQKGETDLAVKELKVMAAAISCAAMRRRRARTPKHAPSCSPACNGSWRGGAKSLVANTGYRRFLAAPEGDGFAIDPAKVEADAQFDGDLRAAHQPVNVGAGRGAALPQPAGGRTGLPRRKDIAATRAGIPSHRRRDPRPYLFALFWLWCCARSCSIVSPPRRGDAGMAVHH